MERESMRGVIKALKAERREVVRTLKQIDSALAKVGVGVVRRRKRRKAKAAAKPRAKAPKKAPSAPAKATQGESLADRKRKKQEALRQREPVGATGTDD